MPYPFDQNSAVVVLLRGDKPYPTLQYFSNLSSHTSLSNLSSQLLCLSSKHQTYHNDANKSK